ncbi:hypothetical protein SDC49_21875 [Lactobacillus sp. R2/2]|nr:hypothetical protein [Lactobacillus sp. R2/2]
MVLSKKFAAKPKGLATLSQVSEGGKSYANNKCQFGNHYGSFTSNCARTVQND